MPYFVNKTDGSVIVVLDGTKDTTSTSLTLFGRLVANYGDQTNENFVRLLENFAFNTSPVNPIRGQLWFDTTNDTVKVYTSSNTWSSVGRSILGNLTATGNLFLGTQAFEIQDLTGNVKVINKAPNGNISIFSNISGVSTNVLNIAGDSGLLTVNGNATNNLGITTKIYVDSFINNLTANAAVQANILGNLSSNASAQAVLLNNLESNAVVQHNSIVGLQANINAAWGNIGALQSNVLSISSGGGPIDVTELRLNSNVVLNNTGTGNTVINFKTPGGITVISAAGSNDATTPVTIKGQWFLGTNSTINALYADLAEYFRSDDSYEPGTVLSFGGSAEVTISKVENDIKVAGVVTTNPAFVMNQQLEGTRCCIALQGRVPCKVIGPVAVGDMLTTSHIAGHAKRADLPIMGAIIGKSLTNVSSNTTATIDILAGRM
jgi:hypothetical protein